MAVSLLAMWILIQKQGLVSVSFYACPCMGSAGGGKCPFANAEAMMSHTLTGGCHCGALRYETRVENNEAYYCHCRMCQRSFGNIFATFFNLPKTSVRWLSGVPKYFHSSKIAKRGFCGECGTPLSFEYHDSERMDLSVGSLDNPAWMQPVNHFAAEYRIASFHTSDGLPDDPIDSNEFINARWQQAYGEATPPGPQRAYKKLN
jgi:hypothetical protein